MKDWCLYRCRPYIVVSTNGFAICSTLMMRKMYLRDELYASLSVTWHWSNSCSHAEIRSSWRQVDVDCLTKLQRKFTLGTSSQFLRHHWSCSCPRFVIGSSWTKIQWSKESTSLFAWLQKLQSSSNLIIDVWMNDHLCWLILSPSFEFIFLWPVRYCSFYSIWSNLVSRSTSRKRTYASSIWHMWRRIKFNKYRTEWYRHEHLSSCSSNSYHR
jgi:hypothetical protein